jgi:hypothetical protein
MSLVRRGDRATNVSSLVVVDLPGESPVCRPSTSSGSKFYDKRRYVAPLTLPDNFERKLPKVRHQRKGANALDGVQHSRQTTPPNRPQNRSRNREF